MVLSLSISLFLFYSPQCLFCIECYNRKTLMLCCCTVCLQYGTILCSSFMAYVLPQDTITYTVSTKTLVKSTTCTYNTNNHALMFYSISQYPYYPPIANTISILGMHTTIHSSSNREMCGGSRRCPFGELASSHCSVSRSLLNECMFRKQLQQGISIWGKNVTAAATQQYQ